MARNAPEIYTGLLIYPIGTAQGADEQCLFVARLEGEPVPRISLTSKAELTQNGVAADSLPSLADDEAYMLGVASCAADPLH
jgi:hypothetical protein